MREEFGARESSNPPMIPGDVDNVSMMSDTTSLHSWHRRVLAGPDTVVSIDYILSITDVFICCR